MDGVMTKMFPAEVTCSQLDHEWQCFASAKGMDLGRNMEKMADPTQEGPALHHTRKHVFHSQFVLTCLSVYPPFAQCSVWWRFFFSFFVS